jgi:hypothetical protein
LISGSSPELGAALRRERKDYALLLKVRKTAPGACFVHLPSRFRITSLQARARESSENMCRTVGSGILTGSGPPEKLTPNGGGLGSVRTLAGNVTAGTPRFGLALVLTAFAAAAGAIVTEVPPIAETGLNALVVAKGFVAVVPDAAGSFPELWEGIGLRGTMLSKETRLVERDGLPGLVPDAAVGVVLSVTELFATFAPAVVEFAGKEDDEAGAGGVATSNGRDRVDCPEIGEGIGGEALEGKAADPTLLGPTGAGVGFTEVIGDADGAEDPVGPAEDALGVDVCALPGVDALAFPIVGAALAKFGAVAATLGGGAMTWAAVTAGLV